MICQHCLGGRMNFCKYFFCVTLFTGESSSKAHHGGSGSNIESDVDSDVESNIDEVENESEEPSDDVSEMETGTETSDTETDESTSVPSQRQGRNFLSWS